jgi:hypothetical protein
MPSRFDYVKYDEESIQLQTEIKTTAEKLHVQISKLGAGLNQEYAVKSLEECYMWVGKTIRDNQIRRNGSALLQEERTNS